MAEVNPKLVGAVRTLWRQSRGDFTLCWLWHLLAQVMAEVDPQLVEAAYDVEAVMQVRRIGTRSTEDKEAQLWWDALQRYKAMHEGGCG